MIITNNSRKQAMSVFNKITSGFTGFIYNGNDAADNGQVRVYVRENHDVVYYSNYFQDATLLGKLTAPMQERVLAGEAEEQRTFDYNNKIETEGPYAFSNI